MALVFQYGSNTSTARLNSDARLKGDAQSLGLVRTAEPYDLYFEVWSESNKCAAANIRVGGNGPVYGVLYEIPDDLVFAGLARANRKTLDAIEGKNYERRSVDVIGYPRPADRQVALTYTVIAPKAGLPTSVEYVRHIVAGLREHGADEDYVRYVKNRAILSTPEIATEVSDL